jgi:uncharacterized protein (DUF885 family)
MMRALAAVLCLGLITACGRAEPGPDPGPTEAAAAQVTTLADAYVRDYLEAFPYHALAIGAPEVHADRLGDHSLAALARWERREDEMLAELGRIDRAALAGRAEQVTHIFLQNQLEAARRFRVCRTELWNVSPTWTGWQAELPLVAGMQAVGTPDEQRAAVARWGEVAKYLDDEIANLREGLRLGYSAPKGNVQSALSQVEAMLTAPVGDSPFVQMAKEAGEFRTELETLEQQTIRPAIARYRDFLQQEYLPAAREAIGVSANPDGSDCYRAAVQYHATVELTAQQVHDMGLAEMAKLVEEMRGIGRRSFGVDDPPQLLALVKTDSKYRFKSREDLIATAQAALERAKQALPAMFNRIPSAPVIIEPYPPFLEKTAPAGQAVPPAADGKPGKYIINAYRAEEQSRSGLEATAFHETYPGHHLQIAIAIERTGLHPIQRYFFLSGFGEGWALYTERLSDEMGLYSSDVDRLGLLSNEALRAARLVVDSGMHALGWTRQQAIDYVLAHTTETRSRAEAEIDRYIAVPGQATAYMIGNLEIRKMRNEAAAALGDRFDVRAFHDLVLEDGAMPLWALRDKVARWTQERAQ